MRELEFLPGWYPSLQRRKSAVAAQAWIALGVVVCMGAAAVAQRWQVHRQEQIVEFSSQQIAQSAKQLAKLDELQQQQQQMHRIGCRARVPGLLVGHGSLFARVVVR